MRQRASAAVHVLDSGQLTVGELLRIPEMALGIERSDTPTPDAATGLVCAVLPTCYARCQGGPTNVICFYKPAVYLWMSCRIDELCQHGLMC